MIILLETLVSSDRDPDFTRKMPPQITNKRAGGRAEEPQICLLFEAKGASPHNDPFSYATLE
jgi:hypothetical protein